MWLSLSVNQIYICLVKQNSTLSILQLILFIVVPDPFETGHSSNFISDDYIRFILLYEQQHGLGNPHIYYIILTAVNAVGILLSYHCLKHLPQ